VSRSLPSPLDAPLPNAECHWILPGATSLLPPLPSGSNSGSNTVARQSHPPLRTHRYTSSPPANAHRYPPIHIGRYSLEAFTLEAKDGRSITLPRGADIFCCLWFIQRDPAVWGDPHTFAHERFLGHPATSAEPGWHPFSMGLRGCPGQRMSFAIIKLLVLNLGERGRQGPGAAAEPELLLALTLVLVPWLLTACPLASGQLGGRFCGREGAGTCTSCTCPPTHTIVQRLHQCACQSPISHGTLLEQRPRTPPDCPNCPHELRHAPLPLP
jgi:hypothetical protein